VRFQIDRASFYDRKKNPHPKAFEGEIIVQHKIIGVVGLPTEKDVWEHFLTVGFNHRIEGNVMVRDQKEMRWFIEIESMDDLLALADENERGIILTREEISIYDDYVE
jgi:hypothetical protein